ncbi:hypothetical protein BN970_05069 [Mycolicibacterium conceptionense]|uniref:DNA-binding phage zinc finger domain-containing protein n=1 Tax=Mycolicibacterium conceptionense TaxID=451644 RepID=A0A0U1DRT0_9MYCO|nr:hypothetical protein [Mycolicibacterium conceptionense]ORV29066.1 hypothetical protein AWB98_06665 [Mycolicibacterium conceptionense]CQD21617.1 hypothetical protein BN970_05069 [Mycolicibacterium conceptionense]
MGRPVLAAYEVTAAASVDCRVCGELVGAWCVDKFGRPTRVPHVQRIAAARPAVSAALPQENTTSAGSPAGMGGSDAAEAISEPLWRDPSEPIHPWGADE